MIERTNVASSPCWLWGMNIKDNHWVWFKPRYRVHHVHVHGCSVITGFFFSFSPSACLPVCLLSLCGFISLCSILQFNISLSLLFCLFTLLCLSHLIRYPSFQLCEIEMVWVLQPYSVLVGVDSQRIKPYDGLWFHSLLIIFTILTLTLYQLFFFFFSFYNVTWECRWCSGINNNSECQARGNHITRDTWRNWPFIENDVTCRFGERPRPVREISKNPSSRM